MWDLLREMWMRPLKAASSGMEALGGPGDAGQRLETAFARVVHDLAAYDPQTGRPNAGNKAGKMTTAQPILTDAIPPDLLDDAAILPTVPEYLARGSALK